MQYQERDYPNTRRRRMSGPFAIFGRGRMLSFIMMAVISIFSFLSNNTSWMNPRPTTSNASYQPGVTTQDAQQQLAASRAFSAQRQNLPPNPIEFHGGIVEEPRSAQVRQIGARLAQGVPNLPPNALRFYVLRDTTRAGSYPVSDGSILVTAGLLNQMRTEAELAEVLSHRITEVLYHGVDRIQNPQVSQIPAQLVTKAGYGNSNVVQASNNNYGSGGVQVAAPAANRWTR